VRLNCAHAISEINNYGFYIERRPEGQSGFTELTNAFIPGHGTTLEPQSYSYTDMSATPGVWYYRLRQVDLDGSVNYTDAVKADVVVTGVTETAPCSLRSRRTNPNPFNPVPEIQISVDNDRPSRLGCVQHARPEKSPASSMALLKLEVPTVVQFDAARLASGVYLYRLAGGRES